MKVKINILLEFFFYYFKLINKIKNFLLFIFLDQTKKNLIRRKNIKLYNYNNKFVSHLFDDICKLKRIDNLNLKEYFPGVYKISNKK